MGVSLGDGTELFASVYLDHNSHRVLLQRAVTTTKTPSQSARNQIVKIRFFKGSLLGWCLSSLPLQRRGTIHIPALFLRCR